jgi:predicted transcriptional regulator
MQNRRQQVTDAEFAVLEFLWQAESATKREITDTLYGSETDSDVATVQKLLQRLETKGYVTRDRSGMAHVFAATFPKHDFIGRQLESMASRMAGGSLAPLVMHLVEGQRLTQHERAKLRALLDANP